MKLKYGQTLKVGFAFLSISAFWQLYNNVVPKILSDTFELNKVYSGVIMAMDNILALFLLPFFGMLSDKCKSPLGKRKPFIIIGTIAAVLLMQLVPFFDNRYAQTGLITFQIAFIAVLFFLLVSMGIYRSPAVALMPDITPKPLRSKANAIINLMGALGAMSHLVFTTILYTDDNKFTDSVTGHIDYTILFIFVGVIMAAALLVIIFFVNEPKLEREMHEEMAKYEEKTQEETGQSDKSAAHGTGADTTRTKALNKEDDVPGSTAKLPPDVKRSLYYLLGAIFFWFMAYNAVETWFTDFAGHSWNMTLGRATTCLTITAIGMIVTYLPSGYIAGKAGRRVTIMAGLGIEVFVFFVSFIYTFAIGEFTPALFILFFMLGSAWALINVNSLPMVVDMCAEADIGRYTGYYYTFSMAAQTITPILSGFVLEQAGYHSLFLYAAIFMGLAIFMMRMVRHGDAGFTAKRGLEAFEDL